MKPPHLPAPVRFVFAATGLVLLGTCTNLFAQPASAPTSALAPKTAVVSFEGDSLPSDVRLLLKKTTRAKVTDERAKYGAHSLRWDWQSGEAITFRHDIRFTSHTENSPDNKLGTFAVWLYNTEARPGETLRFEFGRGSERDCWFDFGLDFTGWRTCWVSYERDMQGKPDTRMDTLRIIAPDTKAGTSASRTLFIDSIVFCQPIDARYQTRDVQVPFVNTVDAKQANDHWSALLRFDQQPLPDFSLVRTARADAKIVDERYAGYLPAAQKITAEKIQNISTRFAAWQIRRLPGGGTTGHALCYPYEKDAYPEGSIELDESTSKTHGLAEFSQLLLDLANAYNAPNATPVARKQFRDMFLACFDHMRDQGWQYGSAQGTVHHLGYTMRDCYTALYLMRDVLRESGQLAAAQRDMAWISGAGRACTPFEKINGESVDTFNTILAGQIAACLMIDDLDMRARWLGVTSRWLGRALEPIAGIAGGIAPDGSIMHHCNHYPAYANGGIQGAASALWFFSNTSLRVPETGHSSLKRAMLAMRFHSNVLDWPLSLSGRHPDGRFNLNQRPYLLLALSGTPDGRAKIDNEVLAAWRRLESASKTRTYPPRTVDRAGLDIKSEAAPTGHLTLSFATTSAHRRGEWLATARGYSRYLWGAEIYPGANMYGRYLAYGHIEILARGNPINIRDSGFPQNGFDWNCWPGTTAIHLPLSELRERVINVDKYSGYEEMLLSDEAFAGGTNLENRNGLFAMKLHEHAKYDGSHRARKSVFFFDDRIIALGSGITNTDAVHDTRTTLFQNASTSASPRIASGKHINDLVGNAYFVLDDSSSVRVSQAMQHSRSQDDKTDTQGEVALAWLDHGTAPKDAGYAYAVLVQPTPARETNFANELLASTGTGAPFTTLRRDNTAHIVRDRDTGILAAACFESIADTGLEIAAVSSPALVMMRTDKNKKTILSVCDPDLHLYEGTEADQYNPDGSLREVSIYSRKWIDSRSAPSTVRVTLDGNYTLTQPDPRIRILPASRDGQTVIEFTCRDGQPVETTLILTR